MSKFFKALENAERERRRASAAAAREAAGSDEAPAAAAATTAADGAAPATDGERAPAATGPVVEVPPPPRPPAYGVPLAYKAGGTRGAWQTLLPPAPGEPGEFDDHLVSLLEPTSLAAEQYRAIRLHIENLRRERGLRLVAISSPGRGDGKTLSAINLAGALAQAPDARVALVEVDVRHPAVARALGLAPGPGLSSFLLDHAVPVDAVVERPAGIGFAVVVAGPPSAIPYELLKSPRLASLFAALRERFDFIVVDTPPVLPFPDVGILRDQVDGFVLVVRANHTPRETVRDSVAAVGAHRVLGVIFNDDARTGVLATGGGAGGWRSVLSRPLGAPRAA